MTIDEAGPVPSSAFEGVKQVFADSRLAVEHAYRAGVPESADIRSSSPTLILSDSRVRPVEASLSPADIQSLARSTLPLTRSIFDAVRARASADHALVAARVAMKFQTVVYKAMCLDQGDLDKPTAIVKISTGDPVLDARYNPPWAELLSENPQVFVTEVPATELSPEMRTRRMPTAKLISRLRLESAESILYRLAREFFDRSGMKGRGTILISRENSLLKEVAFHLAKRGYAVRGLGTTSFEGSERSVGAEVSGEAVRSASEAMGPHLTRRLVEGVRAPTLRLYEERVRKAVSEYDAALPRWIAVLGAQRKDLVAVLTNFPFSPSDVALHAACQAIGVPLVSAQHGVTRELNSQSPTIQIAYENNSCDLLLTYNQKAARMSEEENAFSRGQAVAVGMPRDHWRSARHRRPSKRAAPIFYVSSVLYMVNELAVQGGGPDFEKANFEIDVIERVLQHLPHRVLFKPYPSDSPRYLDPDPIISAAVLASNLEVYTERNDLRYLLPDARVLVASFGTSTVGWCLMADRPLVFIDHPDFIPLRPEVREMFEEGVFLFDASDPDFHERLREFLSKPLPEIDRLWEDRSEARAALTTELIETGGPGAGRRGARVVLETAHAERDRFAKRKTTETAEAE